MGSARAAELIRLLRLEPHPEGGAYREIFRSPLRVQPAEGTGRSALTTIYYLLTHGRHSRWHRVAHDEIWHWLEGDPLELSCVAPDGSRIERRVLGPLGAGAEPVVVVPAGHWQSARCTGGYMLAGCTMGPGFEFADFALATDVADAAAMLRALDPSFANWL